ncbi:MAG: hypothetical protein MJ252_03425 [archaeon]|nr:hypothetical protein [archaeon]
MKSMHYQKLVPKKGQEKSNSKNYLSKSEDSFSIKNKKNITLTDKKKKDALIKKLTKSSSCFNLTKFPKTNEEKEKSNIPSMSYKKAINSTFLYMKKILPFHVYQSITKNYRYELNKELLSQEKKESNSFEKKHKSSIGLNNKDLQANTKIKNKSMSVEGSQRKNSERKIKSPSNKKEYQIIFNSNKNSISKSMNSSLNDSTNNQKNKNSGNNVNNIFLNSVFQNKKHSLFSITKAKLKKNQFKQVTRKPSTDSKNKVNIQPVNPKIKEKESEKEKGNKNRPKSKCQKNCSRNKIFSSKIDLEGSTNLKNFLEQIRSKLKSKIQTGHAEDYIQKNPNKKKITIKNKDVPPIKKKNIPSKGKNESIGNECNNMDSKSVIDSKSKLSCINTNFCTNGTNTRRQKNDSEGLSNLKECLKKEGTTEENNTAQLKKIKNSLDDNLKHMFNFSYEGFLNKESETDGKSFEENVHFLYSGNQEDKK